MGTANIHFHRELVALAGSERTDELMRSVFTELRLAFHVVDDPRRLHEPYIARNAEILAALETSERETAERLLAVYLENSLKRVVEVYLRRGQRRGIGVSFGSGRSGQRCSLRPDPRGVRVRAAARRRRATGRSPGNRLQRRKWACQAPRPRQDPNDTPGPPRAGPRKRGGPPAEACRVGAHLRRLGRCQTEDLVCAP